MTRDEVNALTDEQLRIKAAELDGWERLPSIRMWRKVLQDGRRHTVDTNKLPNYPGDMTVTVQLWFPDKYLHLHRISPGFGGCAAEYIRHIGGLSKTYGLYEERREGEPISKTCARAITRAFILAIDNGKEVEDG